MFYYQRLTRFCFFSLLFRIRMQPKPSSSPAWPRWVSPCCPSSPAQHPHPHKPSPATLNWRYERLFKKRKPTKCMNCMITWLFSRNSVSQSVLFLPSISCVINSNSTVMYTGTHMCLIGPECVPNERASSCTLPSASPPHLQSFSLTTGWTHTSHLTHFLIFLLSIDHTSVHKHFEIVSFHSFSRNSLDACFYGNSQPPACDAHGRSWLPSEQCIRLYTPYFFFYLLNCVKVPKHPDV